MRRVNWNQFSVYAIRAHKAFATGQRFHISKLTRNADDELVTSHSGRASGRST